MAITLKAARVNAGLSQAEAAEKLGVTPAMVSNWERRISYPTVPNIKKIEAVYGIKYADLIFLPDDNG